ncbi:hypothetical protein ASD15_06860 [Massilia sp. Root351]|nr:hypothetical protein ASD15_06860 [Massilia sp. Root351]
MLEKDMLNKLILGAVLSAGALAGCARQEAPAAVAATATAAATVAAPAASGPAVRVSPDLAMAGVDATPLLKALFGDYATAKDGGVVATLNDPDQPGSQGLYLLSRVASTVLPGGETVLVFNGEACNEAGEAQTAHATPGLLSFFLLKQEQGAWRVLRRHENVAALGSFGNVGTLSWVALAPGKVGLAAEHGGTWQGYTSLFLALIDVSDPQPRDLMGEEAQVLADTEGACGGRVAECWDVRARWRILQPAAGARYGALAMDFDGEQRVATPASLAAADADADEDNVVRTTKRIGGSARYVYDGKAYKLASGANPIPTF